MAGRRGVVAVMGATSLALVCTKDQNSFQFLNLEPKKSPQIIKCLKKERPPPNPQTEHLSGH